MALSGKIETEVEIKAAAGRVFNFFKSQLHKTPHVSSNNVHHVELHEGDWESEGSVKHWKYNLGGNLLALKETVEKIDEANKAITYSILEGDLKNHHKDFKVTVKATPKGEGGSLVKFTIEYEKVSPNEPDPDAYLDFATDVTKDIEAHLLKES